MEKKATVNVTVTNCNNPLQFAGAFMDVCKCVNAHVVGHKTHVVE